MKQKLKSNNGFTLSEVLMTVLILTLVTSVIAGGVGVARTVYMRVTLKAEALTLQSTVISSIMSELRYAENIEVSDDGTVWFDSPSRGYRMSFDADGTEGIVVKSTDTTASVPLVTDKTRTNGLIPSMTCTYGYGQELNESTVKQFTVIVSVAKDGKKYASEKTIKVRPVNIQYD